MKLRVLSGHKVSVAPGLLSSRVWHGSFRDDGLGVKRFQQIMGSSFLMDKQCISIELREQLCFASVASCRSL
eukprot:scaffold12350_cov171-Amphora_coffeaeformis.AAC.1